MDNGITEECYWFYGNHGDYKVYRVHDMDKFDKYMRRLYNDFYESKYFDTKILNLEEISEEDREKLIELCEVNYQTHDWYVFAIKRNNVPCYDCLSKNAMYLINHLVKGFWYDETDWEYINYHDHQFYLYMFENYYNND